MHDALQRAGHGAVAGAVGAACMTALRMGAHRAGLIERQVPQVVEELQVQQERPPATERARRHARLG